MLLHKIHSTTTADTETMLTTPAKLQEPIPHDLDALLKARAIKTNLIRVTLLYVNFGQNDIPLNWLRYTRNLNIGSYLFIATDSEMFNCLVCFKEPVVHCKIRETLYQWKEFLLLMLGRTTVALEVLKTG